MNPTNPPRFAARGLIPTAEQTSIQLAQERVVLIEANAGAAKTTTLALRIGEALARNLAPEQIFALVFTPEARDVMRQRLVDIGIAAPIAARVGVATFEDFSSRMLMQFEGGDPVPRLQAKQLKAYVLEALEMVSENYRGRVEYLDLQTHNIAISQFLEAQLELKATMALDQDLEYLGPEEAAELLKVPVADYLTSLEYERLRLGSFEGTLFRGPYDATYDLAHKLGETPELAQELPDYRIVLCDELHDLNEAAFRILNALIQRPRCYFVGAGDKDQVIHARLGASEAYLSSRFADSYPALVRYPLTLSYRHGPHLAYAMADLKQKAVDSSLPLRTEIRQSHYAATPQDCAARVVAAIDEWKRERLPLDGCAILIRDRHQSVAIENALLQAQIGYRTLDLTGYLQREEILFLRAMIAIGLKNLDTVRSEPVRKAMVEALVIFGEVELTAQELEEAKNVIARDPATLGFFFSGQIQRSKSAAARGRIAAAVAYVEAVEPETRADVVLRAVCEQMALATLARRIFVHPYDASVVAKSVAGFLDAAAASGLNLRQFSEWLGAAEAASNQKKGKQLVLLENVANAKGKEFEHVILPFLEEGEFPNALCAVADEENLFYVGATRARSRLTLISPQAEDQRSRFIKQMKLAASLERANAAVATNEAAARQRGTVNKTAAAGLAEGRRDLKLRAFEEKDMVKALGAKWDPTRKVWYVEGGTDLKPFTAWLNTTI